MTSTFRPPVVDAGAAGDSLPRVSSIFRTASIRRICQSRSIVRGLEPAPETSEIWPPFQFTISLKAAIPSLPGAVAWRTWPLSK